MTDDISKVNPYPTGSPEWRQFEKYLRNRRIESAAPVDVSWVPSAPPPPFVSEDYAAGWNAAQTVGNDKLCTLARQLAEAKAANEIAASVHEHERINFQVQLSAATRRVAEVEGLLREWLDWHDDNSGWIKPPPTKATTIALKKEPI